MRKRAVNPALQRCGVRGRTWLTPRARTRTRMQEVNGDGLYQVYDDMMVVATLL